MCFNQPMTMFFVVCGLLTAGWAYQNTKNMALVSGILYFVAMELLQYFQYDYIDKCDDPINQKLTIVGFLHISFQPYFTHLLNGAFMRKPEKVAQFSVIKRLSLIAGTFMFLRVVSDETSYPTCDNNEWVRGNRLCTYSGLYHLAWELPLRSPTYFTPSNFIHFFMMFAPFFSMEPRFMLNGVVLFLTGPGLAAFITPNLHEQASIWCFFSIAQIFLVVVMLRSNLKGRGRWGTTQKKTK